MKRDFKGIWIPKSIWLNENLTIIEKIFLVEIDSLDNEGGCFAGNKYFSEFFNLSKNRCSEIIKSLEKKGLISIDLIRKDKQIIERNIKVKGIRKIDYPYSENRDNPIRKIDYPYSENSEDNNTIINNTIINNTQKKNVDLEGIDLKMYAKYIGDYFGKTSEVQQMKVYGFLNNLGSDLQAFLKQFESYKMYKSIANEKVHRFETFCTEWNEQDWNLLLNNLNKNDKTEVIPIYRRKLS